MLFEFAVKLYISVSDEMGGLVRVKCFDYCYSKKCCYHDVGEQVFYVDKQLLEESSEVFKTMFQLPFLERNNNEIFIEDVPYFVLRRLMTYLEYGVVVASYSFMKDMELYRAADKYMIESLKLRLENYLLTKFGPVDSEKCLIEEVISHVRIYGISNMEFPYIPEYRIILELAMKDFHKMVCYYCMRRAEDSTEVGK